MTRRLATFGLALTLLLLALAGCAAPSGSSAPSGASASPAASAGVALEGSNWTVTTIGGTTVLADAKPTMAFGNDGKVSGSAGCNQYSGPFRVDGGSITIGDLASTLMLCDGERGAQEVAFLAALRGAQTWRVTPEGHLELNGVSLIRAEPGDAAGPATPAPSVRLVGTRWALVEMDDTADFANLVPTIEFGDGTVSGFAGCNTFTGSYTADESTITIGPFATTKIACGPPASAVETAYLAGLADAKGWAIGGDGRLSLGGFHLLRFAAR